MSIFFGNLKLSCAAKDYNISVLYSVHVYFVNALICSQVKVKVSVNLHGVFLVASATMTKKDEQVEEQPPDETMETEEEEGGV